MNISILLEKAEAQLAQEKKDDPAAISSQHEMMVHEKMSSEVEALVKDDKDLEKKHTLHLWDFAGQVREYLFSLVPCNNIMTAFKQVYGQTSSPCCTSTSTHCLDI